MSSGEPTVQLSGQGKSQGGEAEPSAMSRWLGRIVPAMVIAAGLAALGLIANMKGRVKEAPPTEAPPVNIRVQPVAAIAEFPDTFELPGVVEVYSTVKVAAEVDGRIEKIEVKEGQTVQQGQVLVRLNTELLKAEVDRIAADDQFNADELARVTKLYEKGIAAEQETQVAKTKYNISKAMLNLATARLDRATIKAPIGGILNRLPVEAGEYATPGMCVAHIVDVDTVKVVVQVPERDVGFLKVGDPQTVLVDTICGQQTMTGKIKYISQLAEEAARTTRVELTVDNRSRLLHSGQIVQVRLLRGVLKDLVLIPLMAVIPLEDGYEVFVAEGGKAQPRRVDLGFMTGDRVQILDKPAPVRAPGVTSTGASAPASSGSATATSVSAVDPPAYGLRNGDLLIVAGHRFVSPGQAVRIEGATKD
ncbi:MAG: efflux RND transporter periplasmic adaptor subunit [Phycisphaerae bacterium]